MKKISAIIAALALSGCANGYAEFYQPANAAYVANALPYSGPISTRISTGNMTSDILSMFTDGYIPVGSSTFNGPDQGLSGAFAQAKTVGAAVIVINKRYASTVQGAIPITVPTSQTTYSTGTVNAFGSGGYASAAYNGTSTTYGSNTTLIPYSINRYDQQAIYFAPLRPGRWGFMVTPSSDTEAKQLGTQRAKIVRAVTRGSPAYRADIIPGDAIMSMNGVPFEGGNPGPHDCFSIKRGAQVSSKCLDLTAAQQ